MFSSLLLCLAVPLVIAVTPVYRRDVLNQSLEAGLPGGDDALEKHILQGHDIFKGQFPTSKLVRVYATSYTKQDITDPAYLNDVNLYFKVNSSVYILQNQLNGRRTWGEFSKYNDTIEGDGFSPNFTITTKQIFDMAAKNGSHTNSARLIIDATIGQYCTFAMQPALTHFLVALSGIWLCYEEVAKKFRAFDATITYTNAIRPG